MALQIRDDEFYVPFYNQAIVWKVREELKKREFVDIYLKGGRYSGKSYVIANMILEFSYKDCRRSTIIIAHTLQDHLERGIVLFDNIMTDLGIAHEWKWVRKNTRPKLVRHVNGYTQEIRFHSLSDLETAGFEPPVNPATGKQGYIGMIWADEMAKKTDNAVDAEFKQIERFLDAVRTAKNTIIRHMPEDAGAIITLFSLNPWGGQNPIVKNFHKLLIDDYEKLINDGYNLAYEDDEETFTIAATTNYRVNTKLGAKALRSIRANRNDPRAKTIIDGMTGAQQNAEFSRELEMMQRLSRGGNIPDDLDFLPMNLSMDIGTSSPSALYLNGYDSRFMVKAGGDYYPTRIITKGEYFADPKADMMTTEQRYKDILKHIWNLSIRYPEMRKGFSLYIDGSAIDTIELFKAYIKDLQNEDMRLEFSWLEVIPQKDKWKTTERRDHRRNRFGELVGGASLIVDPNECPYFYTETGKIVSRQSEQKFDHCYDGVMYGVMPLYKMVLTGIQLRSLQGKKNEVKEED